MGDIRYAVLDGSGDTGRIITDIKILVVGQEVSMFSGPYTQKGKVAKITHEGAEVLVRIGSWDAYERLYFDTNGCSYATDNPLAPPEFDGWGGGGTYEAGPWKLRSQ